MKIIQPSEKLRSFVRYYWVLESNEPFSILTFPIGCPQIIFYRTTPLYIPELDKSQSNFTISGQVNFPAHIQSDGRLDINEVVQAIFDSEDHNECIAILDKYLLSKIKPCLNISRIGESIKAMFHIPSMTVRSLADIACLSKRQYERIFRETVCMNPKEYARVVRFQKSLWLMQNGELNYAGITSACGFSDQSHFIRNFKSMSGHTPRTLCQYCHPYSDLFANPG